jgi:hypothetical protein
LRWLDTMTEALVPWFEVPSDVVVDPRARDAAWRCGTTVCLLKPVPLAARMSLPHTLVESFILPEESESESGSTLGPRPEPDERLRVVLHARRGGRARNVLRALTAALPPDRITIVALRRDAESVNIAIAELSGRPEVLLEPRERGSAAGVLLAACRIYQRDADATLAVVTAGSRVAPGPTFVDTLEEAGRFVHRYPRWILLLGQRMDRRTSGLWIAPDSVLACSETAPVWRVSTLGRGSRPPAESDRTAAFRATGILVAKAARLVNRGRKLVPRVQSALLQAASWIGDQAEARALQRAYAVIPRLDLATAMLEPSTTDLAVAEPRGASWFRRPRLLRGTP